MNIIWQSVKFNESDIVARYARGYSDNTIKFFDVNTKNKTIREYWMHRKDVEPAIAAQVHVADGYYDNVKLENWK